MKTLATELGHAMRKMRKLRGLSQDELALRAEIDRSYIGRIERAEVNLTLDMLYKIADVLDCEPHELLPTRASLRV
ncbi:helix-turn-helix transcriptional regulator [Shewanella sp. LC6]|uniref:helix-turn-helix domain-containing protein n=1 Tax=unclassified Shewanella TaxID=196818 RepID=UPI00112E2B79|nr:MULTISPECIES: helix-turn-helix transcriptional regulator [unclassified Shewanella]QQK58813.1 helix-turn-helix transcriptional regulator [Shewanella sp. LC6]TPE50621.1 helix-turn-helix transcriptional regulator [Shewanella sp. LC2]